MALAAATRCTAAFAEECSAAVLVRLLKYKFFAWHGLALLGLAFDQNEFRKPARNASSAGSSQEDLRRLNRGNRMKNDLAAGSRHWLRWVGNFVASLLVACLAGGCGKRPPGPQEFEKVPPPVLKDGVIKLTVAHVVNPRFEKFSEAQIEVFLDSLKSTTKAQLGRDIEFGKVETFAIADFFAPLPSYAAGWRKPFIYDFKAGKGNRAQLEAAYANSISNQKTPAKDWATYAAREIGLERLDTDPTLWKKRFTDTHLQRLESLKSVMATDGKPVIDETPYNEWIFWNMLGELPRAFDVVITNQLVASVEYGSVDIHTALRGGITVGTTDYARRTSAMGAQFWWSTLPFTSNDPVIVKMRGGERYEPTEAARLAGAGAAHEMGHLLFHYGHPFGVDTCLMSPTPMLRFRETASRWDPKACAAANDPSMKTGVASVKRPIYPPELIALEKEAAKP